MMKAQTQANAAMASVQANSQKRMPEAAASDGVTARSGPRKRASRMLYGPCFHPAGTPHGHAAAARSFPSGGTHGQDQLSHPRDQQRSREGLLRFLASQFDGQCRG